MLESNTTKTMLRRTPRFGMVIAIALSLAALAGCGGRSGIADISTPPPKGASSFFGMDTNQTTDPWPGSMVPLASWRSLGGSVKWADIEPTCDGGNNPTNSCFDWTRLDQWMSDAQAGGQDVMFTVYATPTWASSKPTDTSCALLSKNGPGICDPPNDLNCDGTGTNQHFIDFVTALLSHEGPGKIKYWELWNEPNIASEWNADADCPSPANASFLMLARMAKDLKTTVSGVDANARFTTPAATGGSAPVSNWLSSYMANSTGASYADIITFHGYVNDASVGGGVCPSGCPQPENVVDVITGVQSLAAGKPVFDTEGSWGNVGGTNAITDPDQQAAFLGRYYLVQMGAGVAKFYWFGWDFATSGYLYDGSLDSAGVAYQQIVNWTEGATVQKCAAVGSQWSCTIAGSDASQSMAIWDSSQTCSNGVCTTINVSAPAGFTSYLDLAGNKHSITNGSVPVGLKPILLTTS
jgi:hypothetical protein